MKQIKSYTSISQIKRDNEACGSKWFEPDTMAFFKARVSGEIYGPCVFVSSTKPPSHRRIWQVDVSLDGKVESVINWIDTAEKARTHAKRIGAALAKAQAAATELEAWEAIVGSLEDTSSACAAPKLVSRLELGQELTVKFHGRKTGALGITYDTRDAYRAFGFENARRLLQIEYECISGVTWFS